jgi:hypothetical protein
VIGRDFDEGDLDAVGVLDPHLSQSPGLDGRLPESGPARQPLMFSVDNGT